MTLRTAAAILAAFAGAVLGGLPVPAVQAGPIELLPVAAVTIYPGDTIGENMLTDGRFPAGTSAGLPVVAARTELVGKVARRTLLPGRLIARNVVGEPELVARGKIVSAVYEQGGLTITTSVLALQSGALDEAIQVRNIDSGKVIVATVRADGSVRVAAR